MNTKIGYKGFASLIFFLSEELFLGIGLTQILNISMQDSWLSIIIGSIIGFVFLLLFLKFMDYEKDLNLFKKNEKLFGKIIGNIINFILLLLVVVFFIFTLWNISIYIQNKFLDQTPRILIIFIFLIPTLYLVSKDIKTISKVSIICFFIAMLEFILSICGLTSFLELDNFKPYFTSNTSNILYSSIIYASYFVTPIMIISIVPKNYIDKPEKLNKSIYLFYIIGCIHLLILFSFIISIFGIDYAKLFYYPGFALLKKINYFDFIQHVENLLTSQWLFSLFFGATMCLFFIKNYLKNINSKKDSINKIIFFIIIIFSLLVSPKLFSNTTIGYEIVKKYYILIYTAFLFIILIISLIISKLKKK